MTLYQQQHQMVSSIGAPLILSRPEPKQTSITVVNLSCLGVPRCAINPHRDLKIPLSHLLCLYFNQFVLAAQFHFISDYKSAHIFTQLCERVLFATHMFTACLLLI